MSENPYRPPNAEPEVRRSSSSGSRHWCLRPSVALIAAMAWFGAAVLSQGILKRTYGDDLDDFPQVQLISLSLMAALLLASVSSFLAAPVLFVLDRRNQRS